MLSLAEQVREYCNRTVMQTVKKKPTFFVLCTSFVLGHGEYDILIVLSVLMGFVQLGCTVTRPPITASDSNYHIIVPSSSAIYRYVVMCVESRRRRVAAMQKAHPLRTPS